MQRSAPPERRRITVVGLRKGQDRIVAGRCGSQADLTFLNGDTAEVSFPRSDHVVVMTKFVHHRWTQVAYRTFGRDRVRLHPGGVSGLVKLIGELAC